MSNFKRGDLIEFDSKVYGTGLAEILTERARMEKGL